MGERWSQGRPGASPQLRLRRALRAPVGERGRDILVPEGPPVQRGLLGAWDSREDSASSPPAVQARQVKGRDPGAQVSSSSPGPGGVGARTSGSGECPFGDVRSSSAAPPVPPRLALPVPAGARPRRPTYTQVRRTCPPAPARSPLSDLSSHSSLGPTAQDTLGTSSTRDRAHTAPPPFVWEGSPSAEGNCRVFADCFCRPPVLFPLL